MLASTINRARSRCPRRSNSSTNTASNRSQTPACCHSRNRRQHVTPETPSSAGTAFHGKPVHSTNKIPSKHRRSSRRNLPGFRKRRSTTASNSSTCPKNSSGNRHGSHVITTSTLTRPDDRPIRQPPTGPSPFRNDLQAPLRRRDKLPTKRRCPRSRNGINPRESAAGHVDSGRAEPSRVRCQAPLRGGDDSCTTLVGCGARSAEPNRRHALPVRDVPATAGVRRRASRRVLTGRRTDSGCAVANVRR